ncbi:hypothetical protein BJ912DRAFT_523182 [Pholiota molesta]|nr:hypothetical protein BJ912DRAFT_523182 [Pholiota molesta]
MPVLTQSELHIELIEKIIDEAFYSELSTGNLSDPKNTIVDPGALSSLALVSHIFRQRINAHRFSIVSFQRSDSTPPPLSYIHAFLDLLRSDVWAAPSMGVARHVRKLVLALGEIVDTQGDVVPHPEMEDGSLITIMNTVFQGGEGCQYSTSDYTLALWGFSEWQEEVITPEFISNIEALLDTRIATLELKWFDDVPPTLLKGRHVKHISICGISFPSTLNSQRVPEYTALGLWNHLESLDIHNAPVFFNNLIAPGDIPMLKALTVTLQESSMVNSISYHWQHWTVLEDLTLNFNSEHIFPRFRVDYRHLSRLTRLTINLLLEKYNSLSSIESSTHQILDLLGPHLPPLSRLEISIEAAGLSTIFGYHATGRVKDIPNEVDCAAIDAVLAQYPPSAISTIAIRFRIKVSRGVKAALALETFRQDGLKVLRDAFPRLNAGARRRVYDSVVSKKWQDRERADMLAYSGVFLVEYTYP